MNEEFNEELISAYLDGELSAEEAARVEEAINNDLELQKFVEQSRTLGDDLRGLPRFEMSGSVADRAIRGAERSMLNDAPVLPAKNNARRWFIGLSSVCAAAIVLVIASISFPPADDLAPVSMKRAEEKGAADAAIQAGGGRVEGEEKEDAEVHDPHLHEPNDVLQHPAAESTDSLVEKNNAFADRQNQLLGKSQNGAANRARLQQAPAADLTPAASPTSNGDSLPDLPEPETPLEPSPSVVEPSAPAPEPKIVPQEAANAVVARQNAVQFTVQLKIGPAALREKLAANAATKGLVLKMLSANGVARNAKQKKRATVEVTKEQLAEIRKLLASEKIALQPMRVAANAPAQSSPAEDFPFAQEDPEPLGPQPFAPNGPQKNANGSKPPPVAESPADSPNNNRIAKSVPADGDDQNVPGQSFADANAADADIAFGDGENSKIRIYFVFDARQGNVGNGIGVDADASETPVVDPADQDD
jgi:anti-sigma factor RsiW